MKNCLLILVVGLMLCVPFGCERGVDEDPVSYERDVDGPPVAIRTPMPDYDIIGNPSAVRRRREALLAAGGDTSTGAESGGGVDLSGPSSPASEDEIAEVKAVIENVLKTKDSGDDSAAMAFFSDEAATAIQEITQGVKDIQAKSLELHSLMEDKFAAQYPDALKAENEKMRTEPAGPSSAAEILGDVSMDQLVFTKVGARVVATGPKNDKIVFSKTEAGWKIEFDKDSREMVGVLSELMTGTTKMLDAIMEGIKDDSITADNVEAKTTELTKQHVAPVQKKLMALMMKAMAGDGDGGAGPADGGAAPADGGAAPADDGAAPADDGAAPADDGAAPADDGAAPADGGAAPADGGAAPADGGAATPPAAGNGL